MPRVAISPTPKALIRRGMALRFLNQFMCRSSCFPVYERMCPDRMSRRHNLLGNTQRNLKREQIQRADPSDIDDGSDTAVAQDGCAHQAIHLAQMPFQALDDDLLLPEKLIDHKANLAAAGRHN